MKKNILIVDDNEVNIDITVELIDSYAKEKDCPINILTAYDGKQAVDICNTKDVDLIFMDLMMPVMDGNQATKIIKKQHPKLMVIVISAVGVETKQKEMLLNGAEDYITKPLVASVFKSRLHNYIQLIQNRNHLASSPTFHNLFTSKVYNYNMNFSVLSEADLSEFWEAMLIRLDFQHYIDNISDFVRFLYRLGILQLQKKFKFYIIIEEDFENFYFTLNIIKPMGLKYIEELIGLHYSEAVYTSKDNKLTFLLKKSKIEKLSTFNTISKKTSIQEDKEDSVDNHVSIVVDELKLQVFDIIDAEDLEDLEEYLIKMNSIILLMKNTHIEADEIEDLCNYLKSIASILSISNEIYVISKSLNDLSDSISNNVEYFSENSNMLFEFTSAFVNDLLFWKTKIFYDGAPSVDFLNDSISTNANMLNALLNPEDSADENIDDIFDF